MSKKRMSMEDKKRAMLGLFHDKKDVFLLKDLERIASKEKGIPAQTVKDVVQSLVDDDLVECEKVGTSLYYWSFPGKSHAAKAMQLENVHKQLKQVEQEISKYDEKIAQVNDGDFKERSEKINILKELKQQVEQMESVIKEADVEQEVTQLREKVNVWTENIFILKNFIKNKFYFDDAMINNRFDIPDNLDYYY